MKAYGISGNELKFIESYIQNRRQYVELNGSTSNSLEIGAGVPQGSSLASYLYCLYVEGLLGTKNEQGECKTVMYSDDAFVMISGKNFQQLESKANSTLKQIYDWYSSNKLMLNAKKTKFMIFRPKGKQPCLTNLELGSIKIEQVHAPSTLKLLGVLFDEKLEFKLHAQHVLNKVAKSNYGLRLIKNFIPISAKLMIYRSLIESHLTYCLPIWGRNLTSKTKAMFLQQQKRAMRFCHSKKGFSHTDALFQKSKILKFEHLLDLNCAQLLVDFKNRKLNWSFSSKLELCQPHENMSTRSAAQGFWKLPPGLSVCSLLNKFVQIYNENMTIIKTSKSKNHFKSLFSEKVLSKYQTTCTNNQCTECT